jgi:hypothetical protein
VERLIDAVWQAAAPTPARSLDPTSMPNSLERWNTDAGDADIATLNIPPALRARRFHVDVQFVVRCPADASDPWHAMTVEFDGRRVWSRQIGTSNPSQTDTLEYHRQVEVPAGAGLRIRAATRVHAALRQRLHIEAAED